MLMVQQQVVVLQMAPLEEEHRLAHLNPCEVHAYRHKADEYKEYIKVNCVVTNQVNFCIETVN